MITAKVNHAALLKELRDLEVELHKKETRLSRARMESLLHPDFLEFGRSGARYGRDDVLGELGASTALPVIHADHFDLAILADGVALLTYLSAHAGARGTVHRHTLRCSVWVRTEAGWRMRFHQGTPTTAMISHGK